MVGPTMRGSGRPKPFQRKRIVVSTDVVDEGVKKEWQELPASAVEPEDLVRGRNRGLVVHVDQRLTHVVLVYKNETAENFNPADVLTVFTRVRG